MVRRLEGRKKQEEEEEHGVVVGVTSVDFAHRPVEPVGRRRMDLVSVPPTFALSDHESYRDRSQTIDESEASPSIAAGPVREERWRSLWKEKIYGRE